MAEQNSTTGGWDREKAERENNAAILRHEQKVAEREIKSEMRDRWLAQREAADRAWYKVYDDLESAREPVAPKRKRERDYGRER